MKISTQILYREYSNHLPEFIDGKSSLHKALWSDISLINSKLSKLFSISRARLHQICSGYCSTNEEFCKAKQFLINNCNKKKCLICNSEKNLIAHHIDGNDRNNDIKNIEILCSSCHLKIHHPGSEIVKCKNCLNDVEKTTMHPKTGFCNKCYKQLWSIKFVLFGCRNCGTNATRHICNGLCNKCYQLSRSEYRHNYYIKNIDKILQYKKEHPEIDRRAVKKYNLKKRLLKKYNKK